MMCRSVDRLGQIFTMWQAGQTSGDQRACQGDPGKRAAHKNEQAQAVPSRLPGFQLEFPIDWLCDLG